MGTIAGTMPTRLKFTALALASLLLASPAQAQQAPTQLDAPLFYDLLLAEMELQQGDVSTAFQRLLDAARRTGDEELFHRVVTVALQARAGSEAYLAARAWRQRLGSVAAQQHVVRLAVALGRLGEVPEPLIDWLLQVPETGQRAALIQALPQLLRNIPERERPLNEMEPALAAQRDDDKQPAPRRQLAAALLAGLALHAGNEVLALNQLRQADHELPGDALPAWLALDLMRQAPEAEALVRPQLDGNLPLHGAYARALARDHRALESLEQFRRLRALEPDQAAHDFAIGSLELELRHPQPALEALNRYLASLGEQAAPEARANALLLKAQALTQLRQFDAAGQALDQVPEGQRAEELAFRRALIDAQQGRLAQGRERLRTIAADSPEQRERRLMLEVQLLRDADRWQDAFELLGQALKDDPTDTSLLYEHAMSAERLGKLELMEQQLRRVIELDPRHHHAHNALGYSLADRNLRLDEARILIERAIELGGHEPFLVDSLGWVAFREGKLDEAERLLRQAHRARPDAEIAAHLAELLWRQGKQDEARALVAQALTREPDNAVLLGTRKRLGL